MRPGRAGGFCLSPPPAPPPVPVLASTSATTASLSFTGTAPDHWAVYLSLDNGSTYSRVSTVPATTTTLTLTVELGIYEVQGETAGNANFGSRSNGVQYTPVPDAPVLAIDGGNNLTWTWSGGDPVNWALQQSADGGTTWTNFDNPGGDSRAYPPVPGGFDWKIYAEDSIPNQVGPDSNVVTSV